jgi:hypothetical protein
MPPALSDAVPIYVTSRVRKETAAAVTNTPAQTATVTAACVKVTGVRMIP